MLRAAAFLALLALAACRSAPGGFSVIDDLSGESWVLADQDSAAVAFPGDLAGRPVLLSAVYTRCPDVCLVAMANMTRVRRALGPDSARVAFATLSFDPERDTPSVLRAYARTWRLGDDWRLLTGAPGEVSRLLDRLGVRVRPMAAHGGDHGEAHDGGEAPDDAPLLDHNDRAFLLDARGRLVEMYSGTATPPDMIADDIRSLLP